MSLGRREVGLEDVRHAARGDLLVALKKRRGRPVDLAGKPSADPIEVETRQAREGGIDVKDAVVDRATFALDELVQGDPLGHALEQRAESTVARAQRRT